jgi:hypothetical protein
VQLVGGLRKLAILAPARIIGVHDAMAESAEFGERRRLARSRHAGYQDLRHRYEATGRRPARVTKQGRGRDERAPPRWPRQRPRRADEP